MTCPLCHTREYLNRVTGPSPFTYQLCGNCKLIFKDILDLPGKDEEKSRYMTHQNGIEHEGYVIFLRQAILPALPYLQPGQKGLDFGCGPTPTLSILMEREGFPCENYDPFFYPSKPVGPFDFVFATECFEHFFHPREEILFIRELMNPGGIVVVMTEAWSTLEQFANWYYPRDNTHVCFFHVETFRFIEGEFGFEGIQSDNPRVFILRKKV